MSIVTELYPDGFDFENPVYAPILKARMVRYTKVMNNPKLMGLVNSYYATHPTDWIEDFAVTLDPRLSASKDKIAMMPFCLFPRQRELIDWLYGHLQNSADPEIESDVLIEKTRDCGLSWLAVAFGTWCFIYMPGAVIGYGSLKADSVDALFNPSSLLEKVRIIIRNLPKFMRPHGWNEDTCSNKNRIINPENGAVIMGEVGLNIGRGSRTLLYFCDESSHYEKPEAIQAALSANSNMKIDISSVNGAGNLFYMKRHSYLEENVFVFRWEEDPRKNEVWHAREKKKFEDAGIIHIFESEIERNYNASTEDIFILAKWVEAAVEYDIKAVGIKRVALDVADEGKDTNAMVHGQGNVVSPDITEWAGQDSRYSAGEAYLKCLEVGADQFVYDRIGVGAGINSEMNRLGEDKPLPFAVRGFIANESPHNEHEEYAVGITRGEMFDNAKADGWWNVRMRCWKCYKNLHEGDNYPDEELISLPNHPKLIMELSQPKREPGVNSRIRVEPKAKMAKRGLKSPNIADAVIMFFVDLDFGEDLRIMIM